MLNIFHLDKIFNSASTDRLSQHRQEYSFVAKGRQPWQNGVTRQMDMVEDLKQRCQSDLIDVPYTSPDIRTDNVDLAENRLNLSRESERGTTVCKESRNS